MSRRINTFAVKAALANMAEQGMDIGEILTVEWEADEKVYTQTGPLKYLDRKRGWFELAPTDKTPGHYRGSIVATATLRPATEEEAANVPELETPPRKNPFIK